jgi:leader peptidase (prepilin peptidase)/N-methyltransferase
MRIVINLFIFFAGTKKSIISPRSYCPHCHSLIKWYENIPLLSFIFLKGRCRNCQKPISWQYPFVELISGLFTLALYQIYGLCLESLVYLFFTSSLIVISFIDLKWQIIPDVISIPGIFFGLTASSFLPNLSFKDAIYGVLLGGGILFIVAYGYYLIKKKEGMGGGDIKLLAMIGAFLGWKAIFPVIFMASLTGSLVGIFWILVKRKDRYLPIPFGPFLALAAVLCIFLPNLVDFYL